MGISRILLSSEYKIETTGLENSMERHMTDEMQARLHGVFTASSLNALQWKRTWKLL